MSSTYCIRVVGLNSSPVTLSIDTQPGLTTGRAVCFQPSAELACNVLTIFNAFGGTGKGLPGGAYPSEKPLVRGDTELLTPRRYLEAGSENKAGELSVFRSGTIGLEV